MQSLQRMLMTAAMLGAAAAGLASQGCAAPGDADTDTTLAAVLHEDSLHVDSVLTQAARKNHTGQAAGDVAPPSDSAVADSGGASIWLSDANVLSLLSAMAAKQVEAANMALQA